MTNKIENSTVKILYLKVDEMYMYHIAGLTLAAWFVSTAFLIFTLGNEVIALTLILFFGYPIALGFQMLILYSVYFFKKKNMVMQLKISSLLSLIFLPLCVFVLYYMA